jgi:hypothetical protein
VLPVALESTLDLKNWLYLVLSHDQVDENKLINCYSKDELTRYEILWLYCTILRETCRQTRLPCVHSIFSAPSVRRRVPETRGDSNIAIEASARCYIHVHACNGGQRHRLVLSYL